MNLAAFKPEKRTVDINQCIMCQWNESLSKQNIDEPLITTKNGREKIVSAADIRKDGTHERLALLSPNPDERSSVIFVYHMNNSCYRTYCHSGKLRKLEDKLPKQDVTEPESDPECEPKPVKILRKDSTPLSPPSSGINPKYMNCLICTHISHKNVKNKDRLCEDQSILNVVKVAKSKQDHIFTALVERLRESDDSTIKSVAAADFYCHKTCHNRYVYFFHNRLHW